MLLDIDLLLSRAGRTVATRGTENRDSQGKESYHGKWLREGTRQRSRVISGLDARAQ